MRYWVLALLTLLLCGALSAQDHANHAQSRPVTMVSGLGDLHHPVSTSNAEAQKFFDQGLRFIYAFNHDEQRAPSAMPRNSSPSWRWRIGVSPKRSDQTTTIPPAMIVSNRHTRRSRKPLISRPALHPSKRPTSKRWRCAFRAGMVTAGRLQRLITMPCAKLQRNSRMTSTPLLSSPNLV